MTLSRTIEKRACWRTASRKRLIGASVMRDVVERIERPFVVQGQRREQQPLARKDVLRQELKAERAADQQKAEQHGKEPLSARVVWEIAERPARMRQRTSPCRADVLRV